MIKFLLKVMIKSRFFELLEISFVALFSPGYDMKRPYKCSFKKLLISGLDYRIILKNDYTTCVYNLRTTHLFCTLY